jgi:methylenetetrahydrofolate dehydrogenase (NADP+)/methenyltetrahydrofolate cyclohydrolase
MSLTLKASPVRSAALNDLEQRCQKLKERGVTPTMKVLLVGNHPPSLIYTRNKKRFIESFGGDCEIIHLDESISEEEFLSKLTQITENKEVHGCFVQLPLPEQLKHLDVGELIPPQMDVDGFHQQNLTDLMKGDTGEKTLLPCTPKGIITMLNHYDYSLSGKNVLVIGRSLIVGKPMALLALNHNATVTVAHSRTTNLKEQCQKADVIISAVGKAKFINKDYLNPNKKQILVDVGMNHDDEGKLCGDIDFADVEEHCEAVTPVPGGVGPMTILSLGQNLLQAAEKTL